MTVRQKTRKPRKNANLRTLSRFNKIKILDFKNQRKHITQLSFQRVINFILQPFFKAYEDFREKRKIERLKKIALEKKRKRKTNRR